MSAIIRRSAALTGGMRTDGGTDAGVDGDVCSGGMTLERCRCCDGVTPGRSRRCLHCGAARGSGRALFFAASAAASTLVACACYGLPPCSELNPVERLVQPCSETQPFVEEPLPSPDAGTDAADADADGGVDGGP